MAVIAIFAGFVAVWTAIAKVALRRQLSMIIAIGGGFIASCIAVPVVALPSWQRPGNYGPHPTRLGSQAR
jgi:hypothetical protein